MPWLGSGTGSKRMTTRMAESGWAGNNAIGNGGSQEMASLTSTSTPHMLTREQTTENGTRQRRIPGQALRRGHSSLWKHWWLGSPWGPEGAQEAAAAVSAPAPLCPHVWAALIPLHHPTWSPFSAWIMRWARAKYAVSKLTWVMLRKNNNKEMVPSKIEKLALKLRNAILKKAKLEKKKNC